LIVSFGDTDTAELHHQGHSRRFPADIHRAAARKLDMLDAAARLEDLRAPPGNRLEALTTDRVGWHSIRVNDRWRLVFRWIDGAVHDVTLLDYH